MTSETSTNPMRIAVAIPCYKVTQHVMGVIAAIGPEVTRIYAVDDACPEGSGPFIEAHNTDPRVRVLYNPQNMGVGGAIVTAYKAAIADGMDIVVKIDGDGQMNPKLLPQFVRPLLRGEADYTKGNRFFRPESVKGMPAMRLFGNIMSLEMAALLVLLVAGLLVPVPILMLHIVEALVQAYIFGTLALIYIAGGMQSHEASENPEAPQFNDKKGSTT